jgi:DNA polymerase I
MYVKIDAKQLEWRTAVWLSGDKVGIEELNSGADIHEGNRVVFSLPTRLISKKYLFRTIFRGSGYAFAMDNEFKHVSSSPDFWDEVNHKFYNKYKGLDKWHNQLAQQVASKRPIRSPFGREWLILPREDGSLPWTVFTNYPVQGTGADLMTVARISLMRRLKDMKMKSLLCSTVHDDIKVDCPEEEVEKVADTALSVFDDLPKNVKKLYGVDLPVQFPGEVSVGFNLKDMKEYK